MLISAVNTSFATIILPAEVIYSLVLNNLNLVLAKINKKKALAIVKLAD